MRFALTMPIGEVLGCFAPSTTPLRLNGGLVTLKMANSGHAPPEDVPSLDRTYQLAVGPAEFTNRVFSDRVQQSAAIQAVRRKLPETGTSSGLPPAARIAG